MINSPELFSAEACNPVSRLGGMGIVEETWPLTVLSRFYSVLPCAAQCSSYDSSLTMGMLDSRTGPSICSYGDPLYLQALEADHSPGCISLGES